MLQTNKTQQVAPRQSVLPEFAAPAQQFAAFIAFIYRQYPIILFVVLLALTLGLVYLVTTPARFTAQATMIIDTRKGQLFQQQAVTSDLGVDVAMVGSQVEILKSENIALAVIKDLHLTEDPEFVGGGGGLISVLFASVANLFDGEQPASDFELTRRAREAFASRLDIRRVGLTYIIEIRFTSLDPERAARIANAIADAYVVDQLEAKYQATRRASVWLQDRIKELREQASTAERAVVEFKTKNDIVDAGGRLMSDQQVAELNSQLVVARAQMSEARARLDRIEAVLRADSPDITVNATVADTLKNDVITKLRTQYLEMANREADWSNRYGRNHLAAVNLRNQMREIRNSILDELRRIAETYKSDYEIARQRLQGIENELAQAVSQSQTTNQAQVALRELESNAQTYRALYDNFLQRYMESVQQQSFPISEARLITSATRPLMKSHPKSFVTLLLTAMVGLIGGLGVGLLRDFWDHVFRTTAQVETALQTQCLAVLPTIKLGSAKHSSATLLAAPRRNKAEENRLALEHRLGVTHGPKTIVRDQSLTWYVLESPLSRYAESIRSIKVAADLNGLGKSNKVLGVTSALPNEGKTTIAAALAQLMAHAGARTILIDCDLRNPALTRMLAPEAKLGILEVISRKASLAEAAWVEPTTNLTFLPAVLNRRFAHTNEILGSAAMKGFVDVLRETYDYVLVDLSPLAPVVDVRNTTHLIDSYVFVIEWGRTRIEIVERALSDARPVYENLLGVVLNKADTNVLGRYDSYRGNYYNRNYYGRYGYYE